MQAQYQDDWKENDVPTLDLHSAIQGFDDVVYPLTMTKEECLDLWYPEGGGGFIKLGKKYYFDSIRDNEYEKVDQPALLWNKEVQAKVLAGQECPVCLGNEGVIKTICRGTVTNFYFPLTQPCFCLRAKYFRQMLIDKLPPNLREFNFGTLAPSPKSKLSPARQKAEIAFIKEHKTENFLFLGPPGSSKSVFASTLFRSALAQLSAQKHGHRAAWRIDAQHYYNSEVEFASANWEEKAGFVHDIELDDIFKAVRDGLRPTVLIEEIDKRKPTEFNAGLLFSLVDALDQNNGQLIMTSNLTRQGLEDFFVKTKDKQVRESIGGPILRRITDPDKIRVRDFHAL